MPSLWSSTMDSLEAQFDAPKPNPAAPIGSGKMPRPSLLAIPDFAPPPPTPSPLFLFQLPVQQPKPKPAPSGANTGASKAAPPPRRPRRLKVWDLLPEPTPAQEPRVHHRESCQASACGQKQQQVDKSHTAWGITRIVQDQPAVHPRIAVAQPAQGRTEYAVAKPLPLPRQQRGCSDLSAMALQGYTGEKPSPSAAELLRRIIDSDPSVYQRGVYPSRQQRAAKQRRNRDGLQCGVDLTALWSAVVDFVFDSSPREEEDACCNCHCQHFGQPTSTAQAARPQAEAAVFLPKFDYQQQQAQIQLASKGPFGALRSEKSSKGSYNSPLSVLTPFSTEKSSTDSSPCPHSLLSFLERDLSPC